jgi:hypothetical protein
LTRGLRHFVRTRICLTETQQAKAPAVAAGANPFANIPDARVELRPAQQRIQDDRRRKLAGDPAGIIGESIKRFTKNATLEVSADNARELSGDYQQDPTHAATAVHEGSSALAKEVYRQEVQKPVPDAKKNEIVFTQADPVEATWLGSKRHSIKPWERRQDHPQDIRRGEPLTRFG